MPRGGGARLGFGYCVRFETNPTHRLPSISGDSGRSLLHDPFSGHLRIEIRSPVVFLHFRCPFSCARSRSAASRHLAELAGAHPVHPLGDHDLGMFAVASIAAEDTGAAPPAHRFARTPGRAYRGWPRSGAQLVALTCLPGLASGQSLFAGHDLLNSPAIARRRGSRNAWI